MSYGWKNNKIATLAFIGESSFSTEFIKNF